MSRRCPLTWRDLRSAAVNASTAAEARRRERDAAAAEEAAKVAAAHQASQDLAAARVRRNETRAALDPAHAATVAEGGV